MAVLDQNAVWDKKEQLERIEGFCLPDEVVKAVFDLKGAGSGFLGITDKRVIFYDKAFFKDQKAMVSIPYSRISIVASEDTRGFLIKKGFLSTNKLTIMGPGFEERTFEFRGTEQAHIAHQLIMEHLLR